MPVVSERKSLMLDKKEYDWISSLAKKAGVARPLVVAALQATADESKVLASLTEIRAGAAVSAGEDRKKRAALAKLANNLSIGQIEALLKKSTDSL